MATSVQQRLIDIAKAEVGYHEGKAGGHWNNIEKYAAQVPGLSWANGQAWCDTFVCWVFEEGSVLNLLPVVSASCDISRSAWRKAGRYSEYPAIGAQVFYGTPSDSNHTGFVVSYDDDFIWAVEGNTNTTGAVEGDGVYLKKRSRRSANVLGYGYPAYPGGIKSADPAWSSGFKPGSTPPVSSAKFRRADLADLSHHNTGINAGSFVDAKSGGIRGVFHKATQGTTFVDDMYAVRRPWARAAGQRWGGYHYFETSSVTAQVVHFLKTLKPKEGDLRPAMDLEAPAFDSWSVAKKTDFVGKGVEMLKAEVGVLPYLYTRWTLDDNFGCMLWVPRYSPTNADPVVPKPWTGWRIDQFTNGETGVPSSVPGFGHVDLNMLKEGPTEGINWHLIPAIDTPDQPPVVPPPPVVKPDLGKPTVLTFVDRKVLAKGTSDHNAVVETFQLTSGTAITTGQANVQGTDKAVVSEAYMDSLLDDADMWAWNEVTTLAQQQHAQALPGWTTVTIHPLTDKKDDYNAVSISVKDTVWKVIASDWTLLHKGAAGMSPLRVELRVLVEHQVTGERVWRQATQTVHNVDVGGKARVKVLLKGQNDRAKESYPKIMAGAYRSVTDLVDGVAAPLIGSGDLNVDFDADRAHFIKGDATPWFPYTVFRQHVEVYDCNKGEATHSGRKIDWFWYDQAAEGV